MRPIAEMLRKANIRTRDRDSTHSRIPSNVPAPVEPPSTHVVTPVARAMASVRGPKSDEPTKQCAWRSISPGRTSFPETSRTASPAAASPGPTSATSPSRTRTSSRPERPAPGSRTSPPLSRRPRVSSRRAPGRTRRPRGNRWAARDSRPDEVEETAGVRRQVVHHLVGGHLFELGALLGAAAREPRPGGPPLDLPAVLPRPVALDQQRVERHPRHHLAVALPVDPLRRHRDVVARLDDGPRHLRRRLVPVEDRALDPVRPERLERADGGAVRRVERHRKVPAGREPEQAVEAGPAAREERGGVGPALERVPREPHLARPPDPPGVGRELGGHQGEIRGGEPCPGGGGPQT